MNGPYISGICCNTGSSVRSGACLMSYERRKYEMVFAEIVNVLVGAAEGAVLAAVVYLVNRGVKHPVNKRKK